MVTANSRTGVYATDVPTTAAMRERWLRAQRHAAPHLPAGAPTSPALANAAASRLDERLTAAADAAELRYTRYADDLTFSGDERLRRSSGRWLDFVFRAVAEEGFTVNARKTRWATRAARQRVTGIVVNERLSPGRTELDRLKAILTNCCRHGPAGQNRDEHPRFRAHLEGRVAWIAALHPERGAKLKRLLEQIDWTLPSRPLG